MLKDLLNQFVDELSINYDEKSILTEDDLRCEVNCFLKRHLHYEGIVVHNEIRVYGDNHNLNYRIDLMVLNRNNIEMSDKVSLNSKGFNFSHFYGAIELKVRRKTQQSINTAIKKDIEKLNIIKQEMNNPTAYYAVLALDLKFNKKLLMNIDDYYNNDKKLDWQQPLYQKENR